MSMEQEEGQHTLVMEKDQDFLDELSDYLDVLGNATRLRILKSIERTPKDMRTISREIETSYENTKKHIDKLLLAGVIRKEAGMSAPTSKGIHPVWKYSVIPGGLEAIIQNLGLFSNLQVSFGDLGLSRRIEDVLGQVSEKLGMAAPVVVLLGGPDDGKIFALGAEIISIGREDAAAVPSDPEREIVLSEEYAAVTRVSRPHCRLIHSSGLWQIEDCGSTGGTFVNNTRLAVHTRTAIRDGDIIDLGKGVRGARLVFRVPKEEEKA
jgi:DNA-binding transcriptional ArsR family regulator